MGVRFFEAEKAEYLCERFLDELQDDIRFDTRQIWPATSSRAIPSVYVDVDTLDGLVNLGYAAGDERFDLEPSRFDELG